MESILNIMESILNVYKLKFYKSLVDPLSRSLGGEVSWDSHDAAGATYQETDDSITHQVVDRPAQTHRYLSRCVDYLSSYSMINHYSYVGRIYNRSGFMTQSISVGCCLWLAMLQGLSSLPTSLPLLRRRRETMFHLISWP